ncbi:hypothetical protein OIU79_002503 [Salix purpurea]|uniref:Uncharacterized protein n=1 Tax=Salix purpurea TaxID=77065 RepID=A0A9Q0ZID5_SALPP|nr:hypothetical protein OIU79_002503 [Salix purpurea]
MSESGASNTGADDDNVDIGNITGSAFSAGGGYAINGLTSRFQQILISSLSLLLDYQIIDSRETKQSS